MQEDKNRVSKLFDEAYYYQHNASLAQRKIKAIDHYLKYGYLEGKYPHPLFSPQYYTNQYLASSPTIEPFTHYLNQGNAIVNPHPLFDAAYYTNQLTDKTKTTWTKTWLEHFLAVGWKDGISPSPYIDFQFYYKHYPYVKLKNQNPLLHYIKAGEAQNHQARFDFIPSALWRAPKTENISPAAFRTMTKLEMRARHLHLKTHPQYLKLQQKVEEHTNLQGVSNPKYMVFVAAHADHTDTSLILLKLIQQFKATEQVIPIIIIGRRGELIKTFNELGPIFVFTDWQNRLEDATVRLGLLFDYLKELDPIAYIVNSVESRIVAQHINRQHREQHKPFLYLIHEMGNLYEKGTFEPIVNYADKIIFPAEVVAQVAHENHPIPNEKSVILNQGLLNPQLLEVKNKNNYRDFLRNSFALPANAFVVLGRGTPDHQKGVDLWVQAAIAVLKTLIEEPIYFIWVDTDTTNTHTADKNKDKNSPLHWINLDLEALNLKDRILFTGPIFYPETFFLASDVLFLSSRIEAFPCAITKAMASSLPVICFDRGGGYSTVFGDGTGICVPYLQTESVADAIIKLYRDETLLEKYSKKGLKKVKKSHNFADYTQNMTILLKELLGKEEIVK